MNDTIVNSSQSTRAETDVIDPVRVAVNLTDRMGSAGVIPERPLTPERVRPLARTLYYAARGARARILMKLCHAFPLDGVAPIFIVGCGRSGTTLLGELLAAHPGVRYLYEPYDLWAAIAPVTDFSQLYSRGEHHCLLDASAVTAVTRSRFSRLMSTPRGFTLVEKSPINALRIGYLEAVAPGARFVHIVRDGLDVAHSIERMAAVTRRIAFRPPLNEWWGVGDVKWAALERDGIAAGYYPGEVCQLTTDAQRGAYEWLLSMHEVQAWRTYLGSRFIELRFEDLIKEPRKTLEAIIGTLDLFSAGSGWLEQAITMVNPATNWRSAPLALPDEMRADFNDRQDSYGFKGRATASKK